MTTNEEHVCGNCKWFTEEPIDHGYVCVNADSPYCAELWCRADDVCEEWSLPSKQVGAVAKELEVRGTAYGS